MFARLSDIQRSLIMDPHRFKVACAGRRGGKSEAVAAYMIYECVKSANTPCLYIGLTRDSAKEAVWSILLALLEGCNVTHEARPSALQIRFPNGSTITLFGGDTPNARNRLRGRKFKLIAADETGFFTGLDPLIFALLPSLADLRGTLLLASSPGEILEGLFYEAYEGKEKANWRQWHWTMHDNPYFMQAAIDKRFKTRADEELDTICRLQFGSDLRHPAFVREYLGIYVRDDTALVYPYHAKNVIDDTYELPKQDYAIGIDLGVSSECAIVIMKHSQYAREVQIVETWSKANILIDDFAEILQDFIEKYNPTVIIADTGGLGAAFAQELRRRYHLPIRSADKMDKAIYQKVFANDLISGYIKVVRGLHILKEWDKIVKDNEGHEVKGQRNHEADAALYVYRYLYTTHLKSYAPPESPEDRMIRQLTESALQDQTNEDSELEEASYEF